MSAWIVGGKNHGGAIGQVGINHQLVAQVAPRVESIVNVYARGDRASVGCLEIDPEENRVLLALWGQSTQAETATTERKTPERTEGRRIDARGFGRSHRGSRPHAMRCDGATAHLVGHGGRTVGRTIFREVVEPSVVFDAPTMVDFSRWIRLDR